MINEEPPTIVLIGGGSAAGKSTLAREIENRSDDVDLVSLDNFYQDISHLTHEEFLETNLDDPKWLRWERLEFTFETLLEGDLVQIPEYDYETRTVIPGKWVGDCDIVVFEGLWALDERIIEYGDITVYVDADPDTRLIRRTRRDIEERGLDTHEVIDDFEANVKPMHDKHVEPTKREADLIVNGGYSPVAVNAILGAARDHQG